MPFLLLFQYFISETYEPALGRTKFYLGTLSHCHLLRQLIDGLFFRFQRLKKNALLTLASMSVGVGRMSRFQLNCASPRAPLRYISNDT